MSTARQPSIPGCAGENDRRDFPSESSRFPVLDFDALYRGESPAEGLPAVATPPWDTKAPKENVIAWQEGGWVHGDVLDIGCGLGDNAIYLAKSGRRGQRQVRGHRLHQARGLHRRVRHHRRQRHVHPLNLYGIGRTVRVVEPQCAVASRCNIAR
jgi:SAM-dependent methyltransferase